jgi:sigma-B regulation protein RsbQ
MMDKNYLGWASFLAPAVMKNADTPELAAELEQSFCSIDPKIARRFAQVTFLSDNRPDFAKLKVPSLIMQCSDDTIAPESAGEFLSREVPRSTFRLMKATGHCPHMSAPAETIAMINDFLETPLAA